MLVRTGLLVIAALCASSACVSVKAQEFSLFLPANWLEAFYDLEPFEARVHMSGACFWLARPTVQRSGFNVDIVASLPAQCSPTPPSGSQALSVWIHGLEAGSYQLRVLACSSVKGDTAGDCAVVATESVTVKPPLNQDRFRVEPVRPTAGQTFTVYGPDFCHAVYPIAMTRDGNRVRLRVGTTDACEYPMPPPGASVWTQGPLPAGQYVFRFVICDMFCVPVQEIAVEVVPPPLTLFDTLPGTGHQRSWELHESGDTVSYARAVPTADPGRLLVNTSSSIALGGTTGTLVSDWSPVLHLPVPADVAGMSADGSRYITGERATGQGQTVALLDAITGGTLFAMPSAAHSTSGSASWPWLASDGGAAVFSVSNGTAPQAPDGTIGAFDGVVLWEDGVNGLRTIAAAGAVVEGASSDLGVLVVGTPEGRIAAHDRTGALLRELCAPPAEAQPRTCHFRGLSPDGRFASVLDEGVLPQRRVLIDLTEGSEEPLTRRGEGWSWVAFDHASARMLYSRCEQGGFDMVVRTLADGREIVLAMGSRSGSYKPQGFAGEHFAFMDDGHATMFVDTRVISADGFDQPNWPTYPFTGCPEP